MGAWRRVTALAVTQLVLLALCADASASPGCPTDEMRPTAATARPAAKALLCDMNQMRANNGRAALRWNGKLALGARRHARDMASRHYFAHESPDGRGPVYRVRRAGYRPQMLAENLGFGTSYLSSPHSITAGWMNSPEHRANLLDPALRDVGVGLAQGPLPGVASFGQFYVVDFGTR